MAIYRKKPVLIEAEQFLLDKPLPFSPNQIVCFDGANWYVITIHNQKTIVTPGDWIIRERGTTDKAYPCKPDIFDETYEVVNQ